MLRDATLLWQFIPMLHIVMRESHLRLLKDFSNEDLDTTSEISDLEWKVVRIKFKRVEGFWFGDCDIEFTL